MTAILDNPIWFALSSEQASLGWGNRDVRYFDGEVAPFGGLREYTAENFRLLFDLVPNGRVVVLFSPDSDLDCSPWDIQVKMPGYQMIFEGSVPKQDERIEVVTLQKHNVPQMLALTAQTQPGPFLNRTIEFGHYSGIFQNGELVAMGGQRLRSGGFTEISAVCTHPEHIGKGYAKTLIEEQVRLIHANGDTAYLHVRSDNARAVALYEHMGFVTRCDMYFYILGGK
jgi:ribosomal protein S18 acetylase RimI-like enzyme